MSLWVIPGSPLINGSGWRMWVSHPGREDFSPGDIKVLGNSGLQEAVTIDWTLQPPLKGLNRRIGVATITLNNPRSGDSYTVELNDGQQFKLQSLPQDLEQPISFLFASCFFLPTDPNGRYLEAIRSIPEEWTPSFKLLIGDQIYCDWPPMRDLPFVYARLAHRVIGHRYQYYWGKERFRQMLGRSPNFFLCDDHEYWNDYPETSFRILRSWPGYRQKFGRAGQEYFQAFQASNNPDARCWYSFQIGPVSFFVADTRSERERYHSASSALMSDHQWRDLESWGNCLTGPGILVLSQPLLRSPGGAGDLNLSNYTNDYHRLWRVVERTSSGQTADGKKHDILVLAGDIHTSRYCEAHKDGLTLREFVASPASMIWPQRREPDEPPASLIIDGEGNNRTWEIGNPHVLTMDNAFGLVRLSKGKERKVQVEFALWRIRPYDPRNLLQRLWGSAAPIGPPQFLWNHQIEMQ